METFLNGRKLDMP